MFELNNEQRKCFGLRPVEQSWIRIEPKPSPYDRHITAAYLDGTVVRKVILSDDTLYVEHEICEQLSDDLRYLLPKTEKGKPVLLSAAALTKRTPIGMGLSFVYNKPSAYINIYSNVSQKDYYSNHYEPMQAGGIRDFQNWVEKWCRETTKEDLLDIARFAAEPRQHVKFREGDVFRFKLNRRLYGYGRVLLDYAKMRREKIPFWDNMMGKPTACSIYHIATERKDVTVEELSTLGSLPSMHMMDNHLYYGDMEIIGHIPIGTREDYPIMCGAGPDARDRAALLQCGRLYRRSENIPTLSRNFSYCSIGFDLDFDLNILKECIQKGSNAPYWAQNNRWVNEDLRNPKFRADLEQVCRHFDVEPSQLIPFETL